VHADDDYEYMVKLKNAECYCKMFPTIFTMFQHSTAFVGIFATRMPIIAANLIMGKLNKINICKI